MAALTGAGCGLLEPAAWKVPGKQEVQTATPEPVTSAPAFRLFGADEETPAPVLWTAQTGTIGTLAYLQGTRKMQVRGYGLLVGLEGPGSNKCPKAISDYLQKEIGRLQRAELGPATDVSPLSLIHSPHAAAVIVEGEIPAAAVKGTAFDVFVRVLDPTVKSLAGGVLLPCNLRIIADLERPLEGKILARAGGRVFTNPFAKRDAPTGDSEPGRGRILSGGRSIEDRVIQLILTTPSFSMIQQIAQLLNERFGPTPKIADAVSPTNIRLTVPRAYYGREMRFLDVVVHMSVTGSTEMAEVRAKALGDDLARPEAPYEDTALCLEALGQVAIPAARKHYADRQRATSFYAARVGARLGDQLSIQVLRHHATERHGLYRQAAIAELGETRVYRTGVSTALRELLDDEDALVRIWAYEALRQQRDVSIDTRPVGRDNFILDVVASHGPPIIYVHRTHDRRIAVFGSSLRCRQPLLYSHQDRPVTISARSGDNKIVLARKIGGGRRVWDPIQVSFSVQDLIRVLGSEPTEGADGQPEGLAIDYPVVIDVLSELCKEGSIPADFRIEQPSVTDLLGPTEPVVRPESDEL
jgi:flagellar basal body P-ring protein FlgI